MSSYVPGPSIAPNRNTAAGQDYTWPHHPDCSYLSSQAMVWCDCRYADEPGVWLSVEEAKLVAVLLRAAATELQREFASLAFQAQTPVTHPPEAGLQETCAGTRVREVALRSIKVVFLEVAASTGSELVMEVEPKTRAEDVIRFALDYNDIIPAADYRLRLADSQGIFTADYEVWPLVLSGRRLFVVEPHP